MEEQITTTTDKNVMEIQSNSDIANQEAEVSIPSVRIPTEEQEKLNKVIDETLENMDDADAAKVVDQVVDFIKNIKKYTPAQKREENLAKMEKEYNELPDDNYKKKQLENKIYWLKKKMFPKKVEQTSSEESK